MVRPKPKSKRTPVRLRHKIEKASAAKQRKQRKVAKKNPEWRSRLKKDPGIPNLFPLKDKLLQVIEDNRMRKAVEQLERKASKQPNQNAKDEAMEIEDDEDATGSLDEDGEALPDSPNDPDSIHDGDEANESENPLAALLASARARATEFQDDHASADDMEEYEDDEDEAQQPSTTYAVAPTRRETSRKAFDKIFKQVVDSADVILYVLDARDPEGTRSREVERSILAAEGGQKRLILVLNKIDLIPPHALKGWLAHLRRSFPTLPLRASGPAPNAQTFNHRELTVQGTATTLFRALKAFAASRQLVRGISVGVIGYPNVGKSSVINGLTSRMKHGSSNACPAGAEAGVTTSIRSVKIDNKLKLIDSPGIVFPADIKQSSSSSSKNDQARLVLLNAVPPKQIDDPLPAVSLLLSRLGQTPELMTKLLDVYGVPPLLEGADQTTDFLVQVARRRGRLGKGGVPNITSAALTVLSDWRDGRLQGWTDPPSSTSLQGAGSGVGAGDGDGRQTAGMQEDRGPQRSIIVKEWAAEFKIDGLWGDDGEGQEDSMHVE